MSDVHNALIIGITAQDGFYLAEHLLEQGITIIGVTRNVDKALTTIPLVMTRRIELVKWDMRSQAAIDDIFTRHQPSQAYNLASHATGVGMFTHPVSIGMVNGVAVTRILEAIRTRSPDTRLCQASSSEMFGEPSVTPQNETTPFKPRSPYGAAKPYAHSMIGIYRRKYGLHTSSAILFNHESPRRRTHFVTRWVTHQVARIKLGLCRELALGNLESRRDWGYAGDYVRAMGSIVSQPLAGDYVIATGKTHSVRELCEIAFDHVGLDYQDYVISDPAAYYRTDETVQLVGDSQKIRERLGWRPEHDFNDLVVMVVDADLELLQNPNIPP